MTTHFKATLSAFITCVALVSCSTANPTIYSDLASAQYLRPDTSDPSGRIVYRYAQKVDWTKYDKVILDPVTVYRGADNQFYKISEEDKAVLADYMQSRFRQVLQTRFSQAGSPAPGTLRIHVTLTGAKTTTPVLGPLSHLDVGGGVYNTVQSVRGKEGSMTGSVVYAVEIYDAMSNALLSAYVTKQYPNAMNVGATLGALKAAHISIDKGAESLLRELRR